MNMHKYLITTSVSTTALRFLAAINVVKQFTERDEERRRKNISVFLLVSADHTQAGLRTKTRFSE